MLITEKQKYPFMRKALFQYPKAIKNFINICLPISIIIKAVFTAKYMWECNKQQNNENFG